VSVGAVVAALAWWHVREFTSMVVLGVLLAYVLNPVVDRVRRALRVRRTVAAALVYLVLALALVSVPLLAAPGVLGSVAGVDLLTEVNRITGDVISRLPSHLPLFGRTYDLASRFKALQGDVSTATANLLGRQSLSWLLGFATDFALTLFGLTVTFVVALYVSIDTPGISAWLDRIVPPGYEDVFRILRHDIEVVWRAFFRGQLILALVVGTLTTLGLLILGVSYAVPLGVVAGILEVVPRLGPVVATVPAVAVAMVSQSSTFDRLDGIWFVIAVVTLYVAIQQIENNFLVPRILGGSVNLPPAVVLVGALAGAKLAGVVGILLAAPVLGSFRVVGAWVHYQVTRQERPTVPVELEPGQFPAGRLRETGQSRSPTSDPPEPPASADTSS
jgi:predicted PurR-regulated permease PerM